MKKETGIKVKRVDFSDPQGGKGPCDRKAATIKAHVRRFLNEGNDITTAEDLRDAMLSHGGVHGVRVALVDAKELNVLSQDKWEGINSLNNFLYKDNGRDVTIWKAYEVGDGKTLKWTNLKGKIWYIT
jgi:DNA primase catalytic subunit